MISEWNKLGLKIRDSATLDSFKNQILNFIGPRRDSPFKLHNPLKVDFLTRLKVGLSQLKSTNLNKISKIF